MRETGFHTLQARLDYPQVFVELVAALRPSMTFARAGLAIPDPKQEVFEVHAWTTGSNPQLGAPYDFPLKDTVGQWVTAHELPFVGATPDDVEKFRTTAQSFARDDIASSCVFPLDLGGAKRGVAFFLSQQPRYFDDRLQPVLARVSDVMGSVCRANQVLQTLSNVETPPQGNAPQPALTLRELERSYIARVLSHTRGRVEGPQGAARILGLAPSTLRHRLRRLDIDRKGPYRA